MKYSSILNIEHEQSQNASESGEFTIFSTQLFPRRDSVALDANGRHRFAVLWNGKFNLRVMDLIQTAIIYGSLWPVKLLHPRGNILIAVYASTLRGIEHDEFATKLGDIASHPSLGMWQLKFIAENMVSEGLHGETLFNDYAQDVITCL